MFNKPQHLIFEGVELAGKSFLMNEIYNILEPTLSSANPRLLDGCHWFNCDVGVFGSPAGKKLIKNYLKIAQDLKNKHLLFEKFHIADQVYNELYNQKKINYQGIEKKLKKLNFKIIFLYINEDERLFNKRLDDRLKIYPHYQRIAGKFADYIKQQRLFKYYIKKSRLPVLEINSSLLPNENIIKEITSWLTK